MHDDSVCGVCYKNVHPSIDGVTDAPPDTHGLMTQSRDVIRLSAPLVQLKSSPAPNLRVSCPYIHTPALSEHRLCRCLKSYLFTATLLLIGAKDGGLIQRSDSCLPASSHKPLVTNIKLLVSVLHIVSTFCTFLLRKRLCFEV